MKAKQHTLSDWNRRRTHRHLVHIKPDDETVWTPVCCHKCFHSESEAVPAPFHTILATSQLAEVRSSSFHSFFPSQWRDCCIKLLCVTGLYRRFVWLHGLRELKGFVWHGDNNVVVAASVQNVLLPVACVFFPSNRCLLGYGIRLYVTWTPFAPVATWQWELKGNKPKGFRFPILIFHIIIKT